MRSPIDNAVSLILILMAASSLISMIGLLQIDRIVHQDLYSYGLQFSYAWAMPYWTITKVVFAVGWFNIIAAVTFQIYTLAYKRKEATPMEIQVEKEALETEAKPLGIVEEQKEQAPKPEETTEKEQKETSTPITETETQENKEETQTVTEVAPDQGQTESKQPEQIEEQKEQQPEPTVESSAEQKETQPETQQKSEETPTQTEMPQEEPSTVVEEPQQVGTSVL